jgi:hypothetical protein
MKKIIALVLFTLSFAVSANPDPLDLVGDRCAPGDVLFYGQTQDHKKEVLVCQWNTTVFYRFGKVGKKPELDIKLPAKSVDSVINDNKSLSAESLLIKNGKTIYEVGHTEDLMLNSGLDYLTVIDAGKGPIAEIILDSDTVVNGIRDSFVKE